MQTLAVFMSVKIVHHENFLQRQVRLLRDECTQLTTMSVEYDGLEFVGYFDT